MREITLTWPEIGLFLLFAIVVGWAWKLWCEAVAREAITDAREDRQLRLLPAEHAVCRCGHPFAQHRQDFTDCDVHGCPCLTFTVEGAHA